MDYTIAILVGTLIASVILNVILWNFVDAYANLCEQQQKLMVRMNKNKRSIEKWLDKHMD